jgi:hypothetical protein
MGGGIGVKKQIDHHLNGGRDIVRENQQKLLPNRLGNWG